MSHKKQIDDIVRNANTSGVPDTTENRQILLACLAFFEEKCNALGTKDFQFPCFALVLSPKSPSLFFVRLNDELVDDVFVIARFCDYKVEHLNKTWAEVRSERVNARAARRKELESQGFSFGTEQDLKEI